MTEEGFRADGFGLRMYRPLSGRGTTPRALRKPLVQIEESHQFEGNGLRHLDPQYVLRHLISDRALCENYYSGAFVKGSGHRYLFTLWITSKPGHQRKGLARQLIRHGLASAHKAGSKGAMLITGVSNFIAQSLYQSESYATVDNVCSFIIGGHALDALVISQTNSLEDVWWTLTAIKRHRAWRKA